MVNLVRAMFSPTQSKAPEAGSVVLRETPDGYTARESADRFWRERLAENALRLAGVFILLAGILQWFLPAAMLTEALLVRTGLAAVFMATGLGVYLFASRGFRHAFSVDIGRRLISHGRLNSKDRCLVARHVPLDEVESVFVQRGTGDGPSELRLRVKGARADWCLLRGARAEIEAMHSRICEDVRLSRHCGPKRVRSMKTRAIATARPNARTQTVRSA